MFKGKPIIGIVGGIGSGKSFVARLFGEAGCMVIDSDAAVTEAYRLPQVKQQLTDWWGAAILDADGGINRKEVGVRVFADPGQRKRLEGLLHPMVARMRDERMERAGAEVVAFVWDTPLLLEAGLGGQCDAIVFVEVPAIVREERVTRERGWTRSEWERREKIQLALDNKRKIAKYIVDNTAGVDDVRVQVRQVLSRIVAEITDRERRKA